MPHQCLSCNFIHDNSSDVILKGCSQCGKKLFLFIKKVPEEKEEIELSMEEKSIILNEISSMTDASALEEPIILKLENVRVLKPGKYEIDINGLLRKDKPLIYKVQEGTYVIDLDFLRRNRV